MKRNGQHSDKKKKNSRQEKEEKTEEHIYIYIYISNSMELSGRGVVSINKAGRILENKPNKKEKTNREIMAALECHIQ